MNSLRSNFLYNILMTVGSQLMALIVFPYVSRILGPSSFGIVNFADSTADNFIIISALGMGTLGVREIVAHRNNPLALRQTFSSLFVLNAASTLCALILFGFSYLFLPKLSNYPHMMLLACVKIIFSFLQINWLFSGLEEFKYISLRTLAIKIIYVVCVYIFVRNTTDYYVYFMLLVGMIVANAIANLFYSRKFTSLNFSDINIRPLLSPFFMLGLYYVCICIYSTMNMMALGMFSTTEQVGYFSVSSKLFALITSLYYAFTTAAMPRMCSMLVEDKLSEFSSQIHRTAKTVTQLSIPIIIFGLIYAPQITYIISGPDYSPAIPSMRILFPMLYFLGLEKLFIEQILVPLKYDKILLRNAFIAAIVAIVSDIVLIPHFGATGSAIAWFLAECTIFSTSLYCINKHLTIKELYTDARNTVLSYAPSIPLLMLVSVIPLNPFLTFGIGVLVLALYFVFIQMQFVHNEDILKFLHLKSRKALSNIHDHNPHT